MSTETEPTPDDWQDMPDGTTPEAGDRVTATHEDGDQHIGIVKQYLPLHQHYGDEMPAVVTTSDFTLPLLPRGAWGVTRLERSASRVTKTAIERAAEAIQRTVDTRMYRNPTAVTWESTEEATAALTEALAGPELEDIVVEALAAAGDRSWALSDGPKVTARIRTALLGSDA